MGYEKKASIVKKTLWEQIADALREDIIRGKIMPGERIVEEEIAEKFHVSRGPVREALRHIEEEGLIIYESHKGCTVREISYEEMQEKYLVRSTLEILAVRLIGCNLSAEYEEEMKKCLKEMDEVAREKDVYRILCLDEEFHFCIVKAAQCETLYKVWAMLRESNIRAHFTLEAESIIPFGVIRKNHEVLLKGLMESSVEEASRLIEEHYMIVPEILYKKLNQKKEESVMER